MESKFTNEVVDDLAEKLLFELTKEENEMVVSEFSAIDENINVLNDIPNIDKAELMTHCLDNFVYELKEDVAEPSIPIDDLLKNCDDYVGTEVKVPKVVG